MARPPHLRRHRRPPASNRHKLILFAFHLGLGYEPTQAYVASGLWERNQSNPDYGSNVPPTQEEIDDKREEAEELAKTSQIQTLIRALQTDPRTLLQSGLTMAVLALMELAFNSPSDRVRLKAISEMMSRGGLPAEKVQFTGKGSDVSSMTDEQLLAEVRQLFLSWKPEAGKALLDD